MEGEEGEGREGKKWGGREGKGREGKEGRKLTETELLFFLDILPVIR
jgi:hypothetical protein